MFVQKRWIKKKSLLVFLLAAALLVGGLPRGAMASQVQLVIDGQRLEASPPPLIADGRTLVPVRIVSETLGATVDWHGQSRTVTVNRGERAVRLRIDNRLVDLAGGEAAAVLTDVVPRIIDGRTYIPLRLVATALGVKVWWDESTRTVHVNSHFDPSSQPPSPIKFTTLQANQIIEGAVDLGIQVAGDLPGVAAEVRYQLLDPVSGRGPVVVRANAVTATYRMLPDPLYNGARLLTAAVYDRTGRFLAGEVIPVELAVAPQVLLQGVTSGQTVGGTVTLGAELNFLAAHVRYEMIHPGTGETVEIGKGGPGDNLRWTPQFNASGSWLVRAVAVDRTGQAHASSVVPVTVAVARRLVLTGVSDNQVVDGPVSLGVSLNFPVQQVRYVLRRPDSGREEVLAQLGSAGGYRWLASPSQAGQVEVLVVATDSQGNTHRSDPVSLQVRGNPIIMMETVAPNQVLAGEIKLKALANVTLARVEYQLVNREKGIQRTIAGGADGQATYSWTPGSKDGGSWHLRVVGVTAGGDHLVGKDIPVQVHTGRVYGPVPIIEKDRFLEFATLLAVQSQERTGMSAALQVAQAILETGWGQYVPVDKYTGQLSYNLFGIKGQGPAGSVISNTWEEYNGLTFRVDAAFRAYRNAEEAWDDHKRLLLTSARYEPFRTVMHNSTQGAWALKNAGYATDSQYPLKLLDLIRRYDLHLLDQRDI